MSLSDQLLLSNDAVMAGQVLGVGSGWRDEVGDRGAGVRDRGAVEADRGEACDRCVAVDGRGVQVHGYEHLADVGCGDDVGDACSGSVWWTVHVRFKVSLCGDDDLSSLLSGSK